MEIFVKNMVCVRCIMAVKAVLEKLSIAYRNIQLCKVELAADPGPHQLKELNDSLKEYQLELLEHSKSIITEKIKVIIIEMFSSDETDTYERFSETISRKLHYDYPYLSTIFSKEENRTIEEFYISHKIEKVKQLLIYENLSIKEISYQLRYSSVSHLSSQFKRVSGMTPSAFRKTFFLPNYAAALAG